MNSFSQKSFDRNHEFSSATTLLGGRPEASFNETLRSIRIMESSPLCKKKHFRDTVAEKEGFLATYSLVFSWKSLLGHKLLILCDGFALRPFGRWARAMGTGRFECAPEKLLAAQRQFPCV